MIFYFSGTGNSLWIAHELSKYQDEPLISIGDEVQNSDNTFEYTLLEGEKIGFVFPIYSWAPPAIVLEFIKKMKLIHYDHHYLFFVCSCGDDIGLTQKIFTKAVVRKGWKVDAGFSVIMPNNYVSFPGFDTDPKELEKKKLDEAVESMAYINAQIDIRCNLYECKKGSFAFVKSHIIGTLFNKYAVTAKPFTVSSECISCGLCEKVCPVGNICADPKPVWGERCTSCLACFHICPKNAIQYGKATINKHQYFNPNSKKL